MGCNYLHNTTHISLWKKISLVLPWLLDRLSDYLQGWRDMGRKSLVQYDNPGNTKHLPCSWWRHQMETFSALLAFCVGNSRVTGEFPAQRSVTRSFDVFFDLRLGQQWSKQWRRRWFDTPSRSLWRHCNDILFSTHRWVWETKFMYFGECKNKLGIVELSNSTERKNMMWEGNICGDVK